MGCESYLLSSVLEGVLAQRLVRRICAACRAPYEAEPSELVALGLPPGEWRQPLFHGRGCAECRGTGYRGRVGIYELFVINEDVRSLILRKASTGELRRYATENGMATLREDGWAKARAGLTTVPEVLRVTQEES